MIKGMSTILVKIDQLVDSILHCMLIYIILLALVQSIHKMLNLRNHWK